MLNARVRYVNRWERNVKDICENWKMMINYMNFKALSNNYMEKLY